MYKQVETEKVCYTTNVTEFHPIATLADEFGGKCQIAIDDGCYVIYNKVGEFKDYGNACYKLTYHIFGEVFDVLKTLPTPTKGLGFKVASEIEKRRC